MSNEDDKIKEILSLKELTIIQMYSPEAPMCRQNYLKLLGSAESHMGWREARALYEFLDDYLYSVNAHPEKNKK